MSWFPKQKVVVPIDFSDESIAALDKALELVDQPDHIQVVHVLEPMNEMSPPEVWRSMDDEHRKQRMRNTLLDRLSDEKYRGVQVEVLVGDPGHKIADFAQQLEAQLIVMPSHGRRGLTRLLIGSVAERVLRLAHCPVLVLRN